MGLAAFNRMRKQCEEIKSKVNLEKLTVTELKERCKELGLEDYRNLKKEELFELLEGDN